MSSETHNQFEPVCRFGPGGDFVSVWPLESQHSHRKSPGRLTRLLNLLGEVMTALLGSEPAGSSAESSGIEEPAYTPSITIVKGTRRFGAEPMLFADDCRAGIRTGNKPKHHIRVYRRTAKKAVAVGLSGQSSLFDADFKNARTA